MRVAVTGGTGQLGSPLAAELARRGHEVLALSRHAPGRLPPGVEHRAIDLTSSTDLEEALSGVEAVVDCANSTSKAKKVMRDGAIRLTQAELQAGVGHHVAISIVGCERVPIPYYRLKAAEEHRIAHGDVPWTLLRATQFHTLIDYLFSFAARLRLRPRAPVPLQPVDPSDVARRLADHVEDGPDGRVPEVAGPETLTLDQLGDIWSERGGRRTAPVPVPLLGGMRRALHGGALCNDEAQIDGRTFAEWLESRQ